MKKWFAAIAAVVAVAGLAGCGSPDGESAPTSTSTASPTAAITDWKAAGVEGERVLTGCPADFEAIKYACYHAGLLRLDQRLSDMPKEDRDIRNVISTYQTSYAKYWATHKCGTPDADSSTTCSMMYQKWLDDAVNSMREGFANLADGRPV